jgi:hypothetical protein
MKRWKSRSIFTTSQDGYLCTSSLHHSQQWWWLGVVGLGKVSFLLGAKRIGNQDRLVLSSFLQLLYHYVRINCSLCGMKMSYLHLCLSASVNVRYISHTQPLELYNKTLVWASLYPSLSLSILVGLSSSPLTPFAIVACYPFTSPSLLFLSHQLLLFRWRKTKSATCKNVI